MNKIVLCRGKHLIHIIDVMFMWEIMSEIMCEISYHILYYSTHTMLY